MHTTLLAIEAAALSGDPVQLNMLLSEAGLTEAKAQALLQEHKSNAWQQVKQLLSSIAHLSFAKRIQAISAHFLGSPYHYVVDILVPWHEASVAYDFCLRVDAFDCMSLVEMVLGISELPQDWDGIVLPEIFHSWMFPKGTVPSPLTRHRFIDAEWAPHNFPRIQEITSALPLPITYQCRLLDKASLIQKQLERAVPGSRYYACFTDEVREQIVCEAKDYPPKEVPTAYIPIHNVIEQYDELVAYFASQPEKAMIATVISDSPILASRVGSDYNVTHLGFLFVKQSHLVFRHATSIEPHEVVDIDLQSYAIKRLTAQKARESIGEQSGGSVKGFGFYTVHAA